MKKFICLLIFTLFFPTLVNAKYYHTYLAEHITNRILYYSELTERERLNAVYFSYDNMRKIVEDALNDENIKTKE